MFQLFINFVPVFLPQDILQDLLCNSAYFLFLSPSPPILLVKLKEALMKFSYK
uniref:Uncharacterized protein n=1 Tax=Octopus bimaculoides TaxID=37653 RepID=A0A0L8FUR8_OCTBM